MVRRGRSLPIAVLALALSLTGCTSGEQSGPEPVGWTQVELPAEPVVLAGSGDQLLVGLRDRRATVVPRLLVLTGDQRREVEVVPSSPYAFEATWQSIAYDGRRVLAVGGARGGAHANVRWTVWTGTTTALTEQPQVFETFGGQNAGEVHSAVLTPSGEALLGTWGGATSGTDAAVWLRQGAKWLRQDPAGTALASTSELLVGPEYATAAGESVVQTGSQVRIAPNMVQQEAAVWRSNRLNQGWSRVALPEPGQRSHGVSLTCTATLCTVAGWVDGKLALWQVAPTGAGAQRLPNVPDLAVGDKDVLPPPILDGDRVLQVLADGGKVKLVSGRDGDWTVQDSAGPSGVVKDARLAGRTLYLIAGPANGPSVLWRTDLG